MSAERDVELVLARLERLETELEQLRSANAELTARLTAPAHPALAFGRLRRSRKQALFGGVGLVGAVAGGVLLAPGRLAAAGAPTIVNYQGWLTDASGNPVNATLPMVFALYTAASGGSAVWTENRSGANAVPVTNGLFNVFLGSVSALDPSLLVEPLYLGISVNGDPEMTPREQFGSVPFALRTTDGVTSSQFASPKLLGLQVTVNVQKDSGNNVYGQYDWQFGSYFTGSQPPSVVATALDSYSGLTPAGVYATCRAWSRGSQGNYDAVILVNNVHPSATQVSINAIAFGE